MTTFSHEQFDYKSYAQHRPAPTKSVFDAILTYHDGPLDKCIDLGCGHGVAARGLAEHFKSVTGIDPSEGMLREARARTSASHLEYRRSKAETLPFIPDQSISLVIACQAAHWFDAEHVWKEMTRVVQSKGTVAFWNWGRYYLIGHHGADEILRRFTEEDLGSYWSQPGRSIWNERMRPMECRDLGNWEDLTRLQYEPCLDALASGIGGGIRMHMPLTLGGLEGLVRTWSPVHEWRKAHPDVLSVKEGGAGDIVDSVMQEIVEADEDWRNFTAFGGNWREIKIDLEMRSILLMARRK
ncbi:S-adenosyl-L-methionine-dependent methyltransferase [Aspergillus avenaceus]|uniref:S-adenosyl-L-methionine-dependent methyltransferase n=1 Tax=Aspergillus avenaceus TaxID=36643 RepID=A0A5N6TS42_ASPAV|nr:S-adenosyl-L-methionine-dependent methyltransferase [Aspergillus avenaceus]